MTEWLAYEKVAGPLGAARTDLLMAKLMCTIANVNRGKGQKPYQVDQFMPRWDPEAPPERRPEMSGEEMLQAVKGLQRTMTRKRGKRGNAG